MKKKEVDMLKKLMNTENDIAITIIRVLLGLVFFPHGMSKLTTMFGGYGFMGTMKDGKQSIGLVVLTLWSALVGSRLAGRRGAFYGITRLYRQDPRPFREDLLKLFDLLGRGQIKPKIAARLPLLEARRGNEMLEAGGLKGKIVLLAPELL